MAICENCNQEHNGTYGSGRFCSSKCARGFSTKAKRKEINEKVSATFKSLGLKPINGFKNGFDSRRFIFNADSALKAVITRKNNILKTSWDDLSQSLKKKRLLEEQNFQCGICGLTDWRNMPITLEFHHIDGNNTNDMRENVICICPNCHSQTDTFKGRNKK